MTEARAVVGTQVLTLQTPEGVVFSLHVAGPVTRCLAWLIDVACLVVIVLAASPFLSTLAVLSPDFFGALLIVGFFVLFIGYAVFLEWYWRGQTIGKRVLRLRVMDDKGLQLQFDQVLVRNLLRMVDSLPFLYLVGGVVCFFSPRHQRLGDLAAGTVVTRMPIIQQPDLEQVLGSKYNSFRDHPHVEARLRQNVSPGEAAMALEALVRRNELEADARVTLFAALADHFRRAVAFPEEATRGVTDEQYVRNVVDCLYNTGRP